MSQFKPSRRHLVTGAALDAIRQMGGKRTLAAVAAGTLVLGAAGAATASPTFVNYLTVPPSGSMSFNSGESGPQDFNLPGYGTVAVDMIPSNFMINSTTDVTFVDQTGAYNKQTSNGNYDWGTDTQRFDIYNTDSHTITYDLSFSFLSPGGPPNLSDLILAVVGLGSGTTATVVTTPVINIGTDIPALVGEYQFPTTASGLPTSPTVLTGSTFSSGWSSGSISHTDPLNTGWALAQFTGPPLTSLNLEVSQEPGDGIGFTVGYVPEPASTGLLAVAAVGLLSRRLRRQQSCPPSSS